MRTLGMRWLGPILAVGAWLACLIVLGLTTPAPRADDSDTGSAGDITADTGPAAGADADDVPAPEPVLELPMVYPAWYERVPPDRTLSIAATVTETSTYTARWRIGYTVRTRAGRAGGPAVAPNPADRLPGSGRAAARGADHGGLRGGPRCWSTLY
nr:hypothetical protein GCM10020092_066080 [Actinoplanes digitatis]